jgi:hypothetical protein
MKVINYNKGYIPEFDCVIHGSIVMSREEFNEVRAYLYAEAAKPDRPYYLYYDRLVDDLKNRIKVNGGFAVNVRVSATELIVKKWNLQKYGFSQAVRSMSYKTGNYQLVIKEF